MSTSRWSRGLRALGLGFFFVVAFVVATAFHLELPPARRVASRVLAAVLDRTFLGSFEVGRVSELTPGCVAVDRFVARDSHGRVVLDVSGVRVRAYVLAIVRELLDNDGKTTIVVEYTRVERASVTVATEQGGDRLGIAAAFTPRASAAPKASAAPGKPIRLWFARAEIGQAAVRLELGGLPPLDGSVTGAQGQVLVAPVGVAVDAERFSAVVRGLLAKELRAVGSFHQRGTTHFWSSLDGYAGDLQFDSVARLDGSHLALTADVPHAEAAVVRTLLPSWPLVETVSGHVEAEGDLPELRATATADVGAAVLSAHGTLVFAPELRLALGVHGEKLDLRSLFPGVPATHVTADADIVLSSTARGLELTTDGTSQATLVAGVPVPATEFHADYGATGLKGHAALHEPGMPLSGNFGLEDGVFDADVRVPRFELARVPRLRGLFGARGSAELRAKAKLDSARLDATLALDLEKVAVGPAAIESAHVAAHAAGPLVAPAELRVDGSLDGRGLGFGELRFDRASARVNGPMNRLAVTTALAGPRNTSVVASTRLALLGASRLDDVDVTVSRETKSVHAHAEHLLLAKNELELGDVRVEGAGGSVTGSARYRPDLLELDARGKDVDLAVMSHLFGFSGRWRGKIDLTAELAVARDVRRGTLDVTLRDGAAGPLTGVSFELATTLEHENLEGNAMLEAAGFGRARATFETQVEGSLLDERSWKRATGRFDVGVESFDLSRLASLVPEASRVGALTGVLVAQLMLMRDTPDDAPSLVVLASTKGLAFTRAVPKGEPLAIRGIDAELSGSVDAKRDFALVDLRFVDEHGILAAASGRADLDVKAFVEQPSELASRLRGVPLVATLVVNDRPFDELPAIVRPSGVLGTLRAELGLRGTLAEPRLSAKASVLHLTLTDAPEVVPFDACGTLQYDPTAERVGVGLQAHLASEGARACSGARVAVASATASVNPDALRRGERAFRGEAELGFEDFPLELVPPLAQAGMSGRVRGVAALTDTGELPALNARLSLADVGVRKIPLGGGDFTLRSDGHLLAASMKLVRAHGTLDADAHAALDWSRDLPAFAPSELLGFRAEFHDMDAAILSPLVGDVLADLSGRLDGNLALTLAGDGTQVGSAASELSGKLTFADGALQIAGLDMRLSKIGFNASARRSGSRTIVAVRDLSAASGSKYPNVAGSLDLYFTGTKLTDARANVNLKRVPLTVQGVSQANLTGSAGLELFPDRDPILVAIDLHDLTAALPRTSGHAVLSVDDNPDITVAQPLREPLRTSKGTGPSFELAFNLARKVSVTRGDMEIPLRGRPVIDLGAQTEVRGDLELEAGGRVQLLGKSFVIESGEVHFDTPDPANPHLRVLASWRAPDGTTVYVDVGGTVRQATLRLESDPALPQAEIQALLLGGGSSEGGEAQAAGLGYGADFVGQLLADTPLRRVELRTGTGTTGDDLAYSTYSAAVPVGENVWVELAYKNLESSGSVEQRDSASAIIDWRFKRDWSLRTEAGTVGTGIDMLWQYRY
jgi:hypothetical protein